MHVLYIKLVIVIIITTNNYHYYYILWDTNWFIHMQMYLLFLFVDNNYCEKRLSRQNVAFWLGIGQKERLWKESFLLACLNHSLSFLFAALFFHPIPNQKACSQNTYTVLSMLPIYHTQKRNKKTMANFTSWLFYYKLNACFWVDKYFNKLMGNKCSLTYQCKHKSFRLNT